MSARYIGDLEVALLSLVLHILVVLVLGGHDASTAGDPAPAPAADTAAGAGATASLLAEHADELLVGFVLLQPQARRVLRKGFVTD